MSRSPRRRRATNARARTGRKPNRTKAQAGRKKQAGKQRPHAPRGRARAPARTYIGVVSAHPDGYGFVDVDELGKGLFLPPEEMRGLVHGDVVEVRATRSRGRPVGRVVRILEHAPAVVFGRFRVEAGAAFIEPRSKKMPAMLMVRRKDAKGAKDGDWVRAELVRDAGAPAARVVEVLGEVRDPHRLIDMVVAELGLPERFPEEVLAETAKLPPSVRPRDMRGRLDLRALPFVTIDGEDARDFDDAIFVQRRGQGFEAWVAIADVAHYVRPGTALDAEARARGNSFYFPDRVLPMLPEKLSNGLCSLNPRVPRLTLAVRMRIDAAGRIRGVKIAEAVIRSHARLTYTEVSDWLERGDGKAVPDAGIRAMLEDAGALFRLLEKRRRARGALDLDVPEVRALLHEGRVTGMHVRERRIAHRLIEELMLAANVAVAREMEARRCALLYRVHPEPEPEAIEALNEFLKPFGLFVPLRGRGEDAHVHPKDVAAVLAASEGKPYAHVLHRLVLRAMQQARYSPHNEGHFGLAYPVYCHFTSPIRRYADLVVHRRLKALLAGRDPDAVQPAKELEEIGAHVSAQERKQQRAEWDTQAMLAALYHEKDVGRVLPARVSGVTKNRVFFELADTLADASMPAERIFANCVLDEARHRLVAPHGTSIGLGDAVKVRVDATDPARGTIDVTLVEPALGPQEDRAREG